MQRLDKLNWSNYLPLLRGCSKSWKSRCDAQITSCGFADHHQDQIIPLLNKLNNLQTIVIFSDFRNDGILGKNALHSLTRPFTELVINHREGRRCEGTMTVKDLKNVLFPWSHTLESLHLRKCLLPGSDGTLLSSPGFLSTLSRLKALHIESITCTPTLTTLGVAGCGNLEILKCGGNKLLTLDLTGCVALQSLNCEYNSLSDVDFSACTSLQELQCSGNQFVELDLSASARMRSLWCSRNKLAILDLSACADLKLLHCTGNELTKLLLSPLAIIESLCCGNVTVVTGGAVVSNLECPALTFFAMPKEVRPLLCKLVLSGSVTDQLSGFQRLTCLKCSIGPSGSIDLTGCKSVEVECHSSVPYVRFVGQSAVTKLQVRGPWRLTGLPRFSTLQQLDFLFWENNSILDLSKCKSLQKVVIHHVQGLPALNTINLTGCSSLEELECDGFKDMTTLALSKCGLKIFRCVSSGLTSLDVSMLSLLMTLDVRYSPVLHKLIVPVNEELKVYTTDCKLPVIQTLSSGELRFKVLAERSEPASEPGSESDDSEADVFEIDADAVNAAAASLMRTEPMAMSAPADSLWPAKASAAMEFGQALKTNRVFKYKREISEEDQTVGQSVEEEKGVIQALLKAGLARRFGELLLASGSDTATPVEPPPGLHICGSTIFTSSTAQKYCVCQVGTDAIFITLSVS